MESGNYTESEAEKEFMKKPELEITKTAAMNQEKVSWKEENVLHLATLNNVMDEFLAWVVLEGGG